MLTELSSVSPFAFKWLLKSLNRHLRLQRFYKSLSLYKKYGPKIKLLTITCQFLSFV